MTLSKEQLAQCRAEFETWWKRQGYTIGITLRNGEYSHESANVAFIGFQAAWRPWPNRVIVDNMVCKIMIEHGPDGHIDGHDELTNFIMGLFSVDGSETQD